MFSYKKYIQNYYKKIKIKKNIIKTIILKKIKS